MRHFFYAVVAIVFGLLAALGWYVYDRGLTRHWRNYLVHQFRAKGFEVSMKRVTLNPFRGLIAQEVKIYDVHNRYHVLAIIDDVTLGVNYANAIRGKPFLDSIDLRDARLSLPLDLADPRSETVDILHLYARLFFPPQQIFLSRGEAEINGVRVAASGKLINSQAWSYERPLRQSPGAVFAPIAASLKQVRYDNDRHPLLSIEFSGDLLRPERIAAKVRLQASGLHRGRCHIRQIDLAASCRGGIAELQQLDATDASGGELHACGTYDLGTRALSYHVRSSFDIQSANAAFKITKALDDFVFHEPPRFEAMAQASRDSKSGQCVTGHVALASFSYRGAEFRNLIADGSADGSRWSLRHARIEYGGAALSIDAVQGAERLRAALHGSFDPRAIRPFLAAPAAAWMSQFESRPPPELNLEIGGPNLAIGAITADGDARFDKATIMGRAVAGSCPVHIADGVLSVQSPAESADPWKVAYDFKSDEAKAGHE